MGNQFALSAGIFVNTAIG